MTFIACNRGASNNGSRKMKLVIPIGEPELFAGGVPYRASEKAYGFQANDQVVWLPKSQIEEFSFDGGSIICWCPMWLISEKGLEIFIDTSHEPGLFDE